MNKHQEALEFARLALRAIDVDSEPATKYLMAVAWLETQYGYGWKGAGAGSFNMGAVQAGSKWTGRTFVYVDTHPNTDGTSTPYSVAFRRYATQQDGWNDLARIMFTGNRASVLVAAKADYSLGVSQAMHTTRYYEGFGKTVADRVANHNRALTKAIQLAQVALAVNPDPLVLPTLRRGQCAGLEEHVKSVQRHPEVDTVADGLFGAHTEEAIKRFQLAHGLRGDGIVGPKTWQALGSSL